MSRLPGVTRESLSQEGQAIWDGIAAVRPGVRGPYGVLMHAPELAKRVANLEDYFRFNAALPETDRELVILATAREMEARLRSRSLPDELFNRGMRELGRQQLLEIIALTGHYSLIGLIINGFDVSLPDDTATF